MNTQQTNYIEVLKDILKNCDMETRTAVEKLLRQAIATATQQAVSVALEKVVSETWKCRFLVKPEFDERPLVTHGDLRSIVEEIKKSSLSKKGSDVK